MVCGVVWCVQVLRIVPRGGTLLLFDSSTVLHAVEPSRKDRYNLRNIIIRAGMLGWLRFTYNFEIGSAES